MSFASALKPRMIQFLLSDWMLGFRRGIRDFRRADLNDDAILTKEEFPNGFLITSAIKAALKPE